MSASGFGCDIGLAPDCRRGMVSGTALGLTAVMDRAGRVDGVGVVGITYGRVLAMAGHTAGTDRARACGRGIRDAGPGGTDCASPSAAGTYQNGCRAMIRIEMEGPNATALAAAAGHPFCARRCRRRSARWYPGAGNDAGRPRKSLVGQHIGRHSGGHRLTFRLERSKRSPHEIGAECGNCSPAEMTFPKQRRKPRLDPGLRGAPSGLLVVAADRVGASA